MYPRHIGYNFNKFEQEALSLINSSPKFPEDLQWKYTQAHLPFVYTIYIYIYKYNI